MELPLLVPAFSSKGFGFKTTGRGSAKRTYSEIAYELVEFSQQPSPAILVSAYDLFFDHFDAPGLHHKTEDYLRNAALIFLDSGGYELISQFDSRSRSLKRAKRRCRKSLTCPSSRCLSCSRAFSMRRWIDSEGGQM